MPTSVYNDLPDREAIIAVARERGLAASHAARRDAESGERDPWWLHCDVPRFLAFLEQQERERGIRHD